MRLGRRGDDRQRNEAYGAAMRMLAWTGEHNTDGYMPEEIVELICERAHVKRLIAVLRREEFVARGWTTHPEHGRGYRLVIDHPDLLLHNKSAAQLAAEKGPSRRWPENVALRIYMRDGDQCRYCGITVNPHDRRGGTVRHIDHIDNDGPTSVENGVVACAVCNGKKQDGTLTDELKPPPDPSRIYLHPTTLAQIQQKFPNTRPTDGITRLPRPVDDNATRDPGDPDGTISAHLGELAAAADQTATRGAGPQVRRVGIGSGPGLAGQGRDGTGPPPAPRRPRGGRRHR
jgi:5-methylcytosine-specific restriction endonuclease McrA